MIAQILNRTFLLSQLNEVSAFLEGSRPAALADKELEEAARAAGLTAEQLRVAVQELQVAAARESKRTPASADEEAFINRDPVLSLYQSALERFYEERHPELIQTVGDQRSAGLSEPPVTDRSLKAVVEVEPARKLLDRFSTTDVGWVSVVVAKGICNFRGKHAFNPTPPAPLNIGNKARVVLVSDWGTGTPRARKIGRAVRTALDADAAGVSSRHVVHLGDVYYSGWQREYEQRFLSYWPVGPHEESGIGSWCLNGNHDMYSGGHAYFDFLLGDSRFLRQGQCSFFKLRNDHWTLLGLDTAYEDQDLKAAQAGWVAEELRDGSKGILLSHHQPFSDYETGGEKLIAQLKPVLDRGRSRAWFWGHEHRCALYAPRYGIQYPRLIGHGGVPVYASSAKPPDGVLYEYQDSYETGLESWALFGFAVLDFDGPRIRVRYINEYGQQHHEETLE